MAELAEKAAMNAKPVAVGRALGAVVMAIGAIMLVLGSGVAVGKIVDGWGFPMSAVPNWGRPWGLVLMVFGAAYLVAPVVLFRDARRGSIAMMIVSGLSILLGTPVFTTTIEILYNLFQATKDRPDWIDAVWSYYMMLHVAVCIAMYRAFPAPAVNSEPARSTR